MSNTNDHNALTTLSGGTKKVVHKYPQIEPRGIFGCHLAPLVSPICEFSLSPSSGLTFPKHFSFSVASRCIPRFFLFLVTVVHISSSFNANATLRPVVFWPVGICARYAYGAVDGRSHIEPLCVLIRIRCWLCLLVPMPKILFSHHSRGVVVCLDWLMKEMLQI